MRNLHLAAALGLLSSFAFAQCGFAALGNPVGGSQLYGDVLLPMQSIGFPFPLAGTTYTDMHICDKGYVWLSNNNVPLNGGVDISATAAELASGSPRIAALWSDVQTIFSNGGEIYVDSSPTQCTITWHNARCYSATSGFFDLQMQLFPSGQIELLWGLGATNNSTLSTWWVGVVGVSPGGATLPAASDLSLGGATTDNTVFEEWLAANTFDMPNNGLLMVPTNPGWAFVPLGTPTNCSSIQTFGQGCVTQNDTFYEQQTSAAFDLAGSTITMFRGGSGYTVTNLVPGTIVPSTVAAVVVANADDIEQTVALPSPMPIAGGTTSNLTICSNGRIALGATGNGTSWTPSPAAFINFPVTSIAAAWHDLNPLSGGQILFEVVGGTAYVTWDNVASFGTTSPNRFQYQFELASGNVTIVYDTFAPSGGDYLTGYSAGGASVDPGALDLSVALASVISVDDFSTAGLALGAANGLPFLGNAAFSLDTTQVPPVIPLAFLFFGDTAINPGFSLTFLGMPGCYAYTNGNLLSATFPVVAGAGSINLSIPNNTGLIGVTLTTQSIAFSLATPLNLVSSNGLTMTIGN